MGNEYCIKGDFDRIKLLNIACDGTNSGRDAESIYDEEEEDDEDEDEEVDITSELISRRDMSSLIEHSLNDKTSLNVNANLSEDIWERYGRKMLEQVVLCEFAKKIAFSYSKKTKISESDAAFKDIIKTLKKTKSDSDYLGKESNKLKKQKKREKKNKKKKQKFKKDRKRKIIKNEIEIEVVDDDDLIHMDIESEMKESPEPEPESKMQSEKE